MCKSVWEWQKPGLWNRPRCRNAAAETKSPCWNYFAARPNRRGVVQAQFRWNRLAPELAMAESELKNALRVADKTWKPCRKPRRPGNLILLVIRPQEVIASLQALAQAYQDYYGGHRRLQSFAIPVSIMPGPFPPVRLTNSDSDPSRDRKGAVLGQPFAVGRNHQPLPNIRAPNEKRHPRSSGRYWGPPARHGYINMSAYNR